MEKVKTLQEKIDDAQKKIDLEKKKMADLLLNAILPPCTSHIYKIDLWGVGRCIFCNRSK